MVQTEEHIREVHRKASVELANWSEETGDFFCLTFFGEEGFRGVAILRAPSLESALSLSYRLELNPGGDVSCVPFPGQLHEKLLLSHAGRLLRQKQAEDLYSKLVSSSHFSFEGPGVDSRQEHLSR